MKKLLISFISLLAAITCSFGQQEKLELTGAIQIGNSEDPEPDAGTIRWTGADFEGFDGTKWLSLTKAQDGVLGLVSDIDGNIYQTIQIGSQRWMAENLNTSKYQNGNSILNIISDSLWSTTLEGAWVFPENNLSFSEQFGKLYNWFAVNDSSGICPVGWHIPSENEWKILIAYLGGSEMAGGKLKSTGLELWQNPNSGATNQSNFGGQPAGYRINDGSFYGKGYTGYWWSSSEGIKDKIWYHKTVSYSSILNNQNHGMKNSGMSVRCIKN